MLSATRRLDAVLMPAQPSQTESVRTNIECWIAGVEKLDVRALYGELERRYPDMHLRSPTNYAALLLAAVMDYEQVVPTVPARRRIVAHQHYVDRMNARAETTRESDGS